MEQTKKTTSRRIFQTPSLAKSLLSELCIDKAYERLVHFEEDEPLDVLGAHVLPHGNGVAVRAFLPRATQAWVSREYPAGEKHPMVQIRKEGIFECVFEGETEVFPYTLVQKDASGFESSGRDPYQCGVLIDETDLHLWGEGNHLKSYEKFGARPCNINGVDGTHFAVWAPNARAVSVIGNFNHWYQNSHPMHRVKFSGVWALFIPGLDAGELYKYAIKGCDGTVREKTDPYGFQIECRPHTAAKVVSLDGYKWNDEAWIKERTQKDHLAAPMSVYEVHLGSWRRAGDNGQDFLSYRDLAHQLVDYVKELGYTHIELMPIAEHPLDESWGYQVVNYFAPSSRFGTPEDFMYFVDHCHQHGISVLMDWVPAHFPQDPHGLANWDGREVFAYDSWRKREHRDWGTFVFDYGRSEVRNFLISNALFWLDKFHIDGLRVDAVASMLYLDYSRQDGEWEANCYGGNVNLEAVDFLKRFNEQVHLHYPGVLTIAEESTAWTGVSRPTYLGGLGFSLKWNMGWMNDTLDYFSKEPIYRQYHQGSLTFSMIYAFTENFVLSISHDEVVHGKGSLIDKMPGDDWQTFANMRLFFAYMFTHPGKKLLFQGSDFAQGVEWNCKRSLDWHLLEYERHGQIKQLVSDLNRVYRENPALYEVDFGPAGFEWIDFSDYQSSVLTFIRWSHDFKQCLVVCVNMTPTPRFGYRVGVPRPGFYREIFNSDAQHYGGGGLGNCGGFNTDDHSTHNRPHSLNVTFPPLGVVIFRHET